MLSFLSKSLNVLLIVASLLIMAMGTRTYALNCTSSTLSTKDAIRCGSCSASSESDADCSGELATKKVNSSLTKGINLLTVVVGIIAVVMLIMAGFRYITSAGDSNKIGVAKNTILYAIVGLVIVALAQVIVKFVLDKSINNR